MMSPWFDSDFVVTPRLSEPDSTLSHPELPSDVYRLEVTANLISMVLDYDEHSIVYIVSSIQTE
jgi:hypothetical protein